MTGHERAGPRAVAQGKGSQAAHAFLWSLQIHDATADPGTEDGCLPVASQPFLMGQGPYPGGRREALAALRLGRCGGGRGRLPAQAQQGQAQVRGGSNRRQSAPPRRGRESARRGGGCAASHQQPGATLHTEKEGGKPVRGRAGLTWEGRGGMVRSWSWSRSQWGSPPAIPRTRKSATCKEQARRRGATWPPVCLNIGQAGRVATCWGHRRTAPTRRGARQARSPWCPSVHRGPC